MNEHEFLASYDPSQFQRPSLTVDLVLLSIVGGAPAALLVRRDEHPFLDAWALPGGFVAVDESLDEAAGRVLGQKARLDGVYMEQLYTFGAVGRDPRTRVVSVAYVALLPAARFEAIEDGEDVALARIALDEGGDQAQAFAPDGEPLPLAFDHARILGAAMAWLRGRLDDGPLAFALLPERFTLRDLQHVHEAILGRRLNKPAFRRRILDKAAVEATGVREAGAAFRPAELYRRARAAGAR